MKQSSAILGAAFLMATSAIGPGFLTQTAAFTEDLLTSFGFIILLSILLDIGAQLNIWRIITVTGCSAQDLGNRLMPGLGWILAFLIGAGGLVFNIANIGGTGLGLQALTGMDIRIGAVISTGIALFLFWFRQSAWLMDGFVKVLGLVMIGFTLYIVFASEPPVGLALQHTFWPEKWNVMQVITLVGGTVGGYISFAGAHRLLDAGIQGEAQLKRVNRSAVQGILITSLMRYLLFLAALGVVWKGVSLSATNPAGSVFEGAAGMMGYRFFGLVMWCAAITSVIGASYTSFSFFKTLHPVFEKQQRWLISGFILVSSLIFLLVGNPKKLLIAAGALNGMILPLALILILISANRKDLVKHYHHPKWLQAAGWIVVIALLYMAAATIGNTFFR